jgi:hypothetical protein
VRESLVAQTRARPNELELGARIPEPRGVSGKPLISTDRGGGDGSLGEKLGDFGKWLTLSCAAAIRVADFMADHCSCLVRITDDAPNLDQLNPSIGFVPH